MMKSKQEASVKSLSGCKGTQVSDTDLLSCLVLSFRVMAFFSLDSQAFRALDLGTLICICNNENFAGLVPQWTERD